MSDIASENPGPQGWLGDIESEHRAFGEMGNRRPENVVRHAAKSVINQKLLDDIISVQKSHGIDSGFSFLHMAEAIFGEQLPWKKQLIGSCVASGDMRTTSYRMLAEVFLLNDPEQLPGIDIEGTDAFAPFAPFSYRAGRKRGRLNSGDGSFCSVHIEGKMEDGILFCRSGVESDTYPEPQSTRLYRQWGNSNSLLDQWKPKAEKYKQLETEEVKNTSDLKELLTVHHKPCNICSSWGFAPSHKHPSWQLADGSPVWIYKRSGSWAHNLSLVAWVEVKGEAFVIVENSWGATHKNGRWFVIPESTASSWLRSASCLSVGEIDMDDNPSLFPKV
jgi:hypothetical protein